MTWKVFASSVIGKHHIDNGIPCQDAHAYKIIGNTLLAAVCDGAGSAKHSEIGASYCSRRINDILQSKFENTDFSSFNEDEIKIIIEKGLEIIIDELSEKAISENHNLVDYSCTLVGVVASSGNGFFYHIGDGLGIAESTTGQLAISKPENSEYSNETFFITSQDWRKHLRITSITGMLNCITLMTDGCMPFVMNKGQTTLYAPFMEPVKKYLANVDEPAGSEALSSTLQDEKTYSITGDDKTLIIVLADQNGDVKNT